MGKKHALFVLQTLEENGFEAYFVGGCVRDWLLKRPVHDIDICTNAHPDEVMRIFPHHVPTGLQHGTVTVKQGPFMFEVTTFRTDGTYEDFRRPKEVHFVSKLAIDLERRDLTINAMAMDRTDQLIDPFHGQSDLNNRLIRAVGEPMRRFQEDALRLIRAARFASQLSFDMEAKTEQAMKDTSELLNYIAVERIRDELMKLIDSVNPEKGCQIINNTDLFRGYPLLSRLFQDSNSQAWRLVHLNSHPQKWSLLFYAASFTRVEARQLLKLLKMAKRETDAISRFLEILTKIAPSWDQEQEINWRTYLLQYGISVCTGVDDLLQACWWNKPDQQISLELLSIYEAMPVKTVKELALNGRDLQLLLNKNPGDWIQHILAYLLEQTALHSLSNVPDELLEAAKKEVARYEHQTRNS